MTGVEGSASTSLYALHRLQEPLVTLHRVVEPDAVVQRCVDRESDVRVLETDGEHHCRVREEGQSHSVDVLRAVWRQGAIDL